MISLASERLIHVSRINNYQSFNLLILQTSHDIYTAGYTRCDEKEMYHENLFADAQGNIISTGSSIVSINNGSKIVTIVDGVSRTITTGHTPNGEPYVRDVVEKRIGDMLYCNETTFNPKTGATETIAWKLNLAIPGSKPEIITDTKTDDTKADEK